MESELEMTVEWTVEGDLFEGCNCNLLCPCHVSFRQPPTNGYFLTYYPNLVIPIRWNMAQANICIPEAAGRTRVYHMSYFHRHAPKSDAFADYHQRIVGGFTKVRAEDGRAVEAVQKARHSPAYQSHYYAPFWDAPHHPFNTLVADDLARDG